MTTTSLEICRDCQDELEHCHGVVIRHLDGSCECADDLDCAVVVEAHLFAVDCTEPSCCGE